MKCAWEEALSIQNAPPPFGNVRFESETRTLKPSEESFFSSKSIIIFLVRARDASSSRLSPAGSKSTPLPSTTAIVLSFEMRISFEPRSPSGPPVVNFVIYKKISMCACVSVSNHARSSTCNAFTWLSSRPSFFNDPRT